MCVCVTVTVLDESIYLGMSACVLVCITGTHSYIPLHLLKTDHQEKLDYILNMVLRYIEPTHDEVAAVFIGEDGAPYHCNLSYR